MSTRTSQRNRKCPLLSSDCNNLFGEHTNQALLFGFNKYVDKDYLFIYEIKKVSVMANFPYRSLAKLQLNSGSTINVIL